MNGNSTVKHEAASSETILKGSLGPIPPEDGDKGGIDRNRMHDRVRWTILERIMDGTYQPGERLKELALAREFHVSQAPVREALRKLEAIGVLKSDPYRGTRVRELSTAELRDAYQLRGILEQAATEFIDDFPEESALYLDQEYAAMRVSVQLGDLTALACHNRNFHRRIMESCRNSEVLRAWESLDVSMRCRLNVQRRVEHLPESITSHQPIIDAFRAGDFRRAGELLREHSFSFVSDLC